MIPSQMVTHAVAIWNARQPETLPRRREVIVTAREVARMRRLSVGGTRMFQRHGHWCQMESVRRSRAVNNLTGERLMVACLLLVEKVL